MQPTSSSGSSSGPVRRQIGPYAVVRELGRGSHGVVYLVRREELQREFALKVLLGHAAQDPELRQRFRLEAAVAGRLDHPGVVRVVDVGEQDGHPWLVMDYVPGPTLRERLRERGSLAPMAAAELVRELARAVQTAHALGIVHRDLKPANVILDARSGRPCVTDFGLAMDRALVRAMTHSGVVLGTPYYMAPEQLHAEPVDARADVWALGVILFECLAGVRPFEARTPVELARSLAAPPRRLRELAPEVPAELEAVCLRALARAREERFPDAGALAEALDRALHDLPAAARTEVRRGPPVARGSAAAPAPPRRLPTAALAAALVLVGVGAGLGGALALRPAPAAPTTVAAAPAPAAGAPAHSPAPAPSPAPVVEPVAAPPRPVDRAPAGELQRLEEALLGGRFTREDALRLGELRARYPDDPAVRYLLALTGVGTSGREHEARRELVRAAQGRVRLHEAALDRAGRFCHMLGFERAGAWVAEQAWTDGGAPDPPHGAFLVQLYLKAEPAVQDCARARELLTRLLGRKRPETALDYPATWMLHAHELDAAIGLRDLEGAIAAAEAAERAPGGEQLRGQAEALRRGRLPPAENVGDLIQLVFATTPFLRQIGRADEVLPRDPAGVERELARLADDVAARGEPENAALALLRAARAAGRAAGWGPAGAARARPHLERALALPLGPEATDTRALVRRALARACLQAEPPDATRAMALAEEALEAGPPGWEEVRTPEEQAEALALLARARLVRGDAEAARGALGRAEALAPRDRRELDALAAALGR